MFQSTLIKTELPKAHGRSCGLKSQANIRRRLSWHCAQVKLLKGRQPDHCRTFLGYERIRSRTKMRSIKMERMTPMVGRLYWLQGAKYTAVICLLTWDQIWTLWIEIKPFPLSQQFTKYKFCTSLSISLLLWFSFPFVLLLEGRISLLSLPNYILVPISHESNIILVWIIWSNATKTGSD